MEQFDVLIIGAGVVGNAVARELSRYQLKIAVLEKAPDICCGTSARNSGVLHAGYNNKPGSKMAKYCVEGNREFDQVAKELSIPFKRTGKLVVGFEEEDRDAILKLMETGEKNGVPLEMVGKDFIQEKAPLVKGEFAMWSPSTGILNPFQFTIGLAENAAQNGVQFFFGNEVQAISYENEGYLVRTNRSSYESRWVINCAGLYADRISTMLGIDDYTIYPCRGEYFVLDKRAGELLPLPVYPVPNYKTGGLGIHLTPSLSGNVFVGPSADYIDSREDYSCTQDIMDMLIEDGSRIFPYLKRDLFIRNFSGIRPKLMPKGTGGYHDFVIERRPEAPFAINLVGIESPGLTSALPLARETIRLMSEKEEFKPNPAFDPYRAGIVSFADKSPEEQAELICRDPDYGDIICRCETITKAEVLQALRSPLGATTMTGVKYRCRTMMGRCQGGYCQTRVAELIQQETGAAPEDILYSTEGSYLFTGRVREQ